MKVKTLRTFIFTAIVVPSRWWPPLVDEAWHTICQAICNGVEEAQRDNLYYKVVEMSKEVNVRHPRGSHRARTLRKIRDARDGATRIMRAWRGGSPRTSECTFQRPTFAQSELWRVVSVGRRWLLDGRSRSSVDISAESFRSAFCCSAWAVRGAVCELHFLVFNVPPIEDGLRQRVGCDGRGFASM